MPRQRQRPRATANTSLATVQNIACFLVLLSIPSSASALVPPQVLVHTAVGAIAGSTGAIAAYPIDYVKSQLQTEQGRLKYKGGFDAAFDIVTNSPLGPLALYRGLLVNVIGVAPEKTIKLSVNSMMRTAFLTHFGFLPLFGEVISGGVAGMTQVIVTNPLEVVKVKMQTSQMTLIEVMSQFERFADLYQGADACVARDAIFSAILFPLYAHLKVVIAALSMGTVPQGSVHFWADLLAGSIAAAPAAALATPADVVKTRLQQAQNQEDRGTPALKNTKRSVKTVRVEHEDHDKLSLVTSTTTSQMALSINGTTRLATDQNTSLWEMWAAIVQEEGPEVLMSGWFERVVRSVPQFGVTLAVYDLLNAFAADHGWLLDVAAT